jgi:hypothetical protein
MGCVTSIFSVLVSLVIIFAGVFSADRGMFGGNKPELGIPMIIIGVGLFLFIVVVRILGTKRPTATETFVITIGVTLLAIGVGRINWEVHYPQVVLSAWSIIICTAGAFVVLCHRRIAGWVRSGAGFFKPRRSGK